MRKLAIFLFIVFTNICFTDCYWKGRMGFGTRNLMNIKMSKEITNCISKKDGKKLRNLFSEEAISKATELNRDIEMLFDYVDGEILEFENYATTTDTKADGILNLTQYSTILKFSVNDISYLLFYIYTPINLYDTQQEGLRSIRILKEADTYKYFCYWKDIEIGICIPELE